MNAGMPPSPWQADPPGRQTPSWQADPPWQGDPPLAGRLPSWQAHPPGRQTPLAGRPPLAGTPPPWQADLPPWQADPSPGTGNARPVRIPLECILVPLCNHFSFRANFTIALLYLNNDYDHQNEILEHIDTLGKFLPSATVVADR